MAEVPTKPFDGSSASGPSASSVFIPGAYEEKTLGAACEALRAGLGGDPTLAIVFFSPDWAAQAPEWLDVVRLSGRVAHVIGASAEGLIAIGQEAERAQGMSLLFLRLPGCQVHPVALTAQMIEKAATATPGFWHEQTGLTAQRAAGWIAFADPYDEPFAEEQWLAQWNIAYPAVPIIGGFAGMRAQEPGGCLVLGGQLVQGGAVAVGIEGPIALRTIVAPASRAIGEPVQITQAEDNYILRAGNATAYEVLQEACEAIEGSIEELSPRALFAALADTEETLTQTSGPRSIHTIIGIEPDSGMVAITGQVRPGQRLQYHILDPEAATEQLFSRLKEEQRVAGLGPVAAILCTCNGRGTRLFPSAHHDARLVEHFFPQLPLAGFFANGEIGPVAGRNQVNGFTAVLGLFYPRLEPAGLLPAPEAKTL